MGQTSRCCMVCLMPKSHVSCSLENPHFNMFTLDRRMCTQPLECLPGCQGFSAAAGRCSSALMLRCTLTSRGSSRSLHSSIRAVFAVVLMHSVYLIKLFCDIRRGTTPICPLRVCLWSEVCRVRYVRHATALLVYDWADCWCVSASDSMRSFDMFQSVSHPVSLHGWSAPTPGRRTMQLSSIALERTT